MGLIQDAPQDSEYLHVICTRGIPFTPSAAPYLYRVRLALHRKDGLFWEILGGEGLPFTFSPPQPSERDNQARQTLAMAAYNAEPESSLRSAVQSSAAVWGLITLLAIVVVHRFRTWYRLRHIPGPFWAGITGWWMIRTQWAGRQPFVLRDVCAKYGTEHLFIILLDCT